MATLDEIVTLPDLREAVGGVGDSEDTTLIASRAAAVARIERKTGRCILDRSGFASSASDFEYVYDGLECETDILRFAVSDIKRSGSLTLRYSEEDDEPAGQPTQSVQIAHDATRLHIEHDRVSVYPAENGRTWCRNIRLTAPVPSIVCDRGMLAADIPETFKMAARLLVKAYYEGTAFDDLSMNSVLSDLLRGHTLPVYGPGGRLPR